MGLFSNFAGTKGGHFFRMVPDFVDRKLPPGLSPMPVATFPDWVKAAPTVLWCVWGWVALDPG
jgi:hypothetical protein